jgi:hypothetical protein
LINSILLIGLGKIGLVYDLDSPIENANLTHAGNIKNILNSTCVYGVDIDASARKLFSNRFTWDSFESIDLLPTDFSPNLVILATPAINRLAQYRRLIDFQSAIWLIEKPLCETQEELAEIRSFFNDFPVRAFVNFQRRSNPSLIQLKAKISALSNKDKIYAYGYVSGNALSNVPHMIDLINFIMGSRGLTSGNSSIKGSWKIEGENCDAYIHNIPTIQPNIFRLEIFTDKVYWDYDSNINLLIESTVVPSPTFKGEFNYSLAKVSENTNDNLGLNFVYENLAKFTRNQSFELCKVDDALQSMDLYFNVFR